MTKAVPSHCMTNESQMSLKRPDDNFYLIRLTTHYLNKTPTL